MPKFFGPHNEFGIDERPFALQHNVVKNRRTTHLECKVHVSHTHSKQHPHQAVVQRRVHDAGQTFVGAIKSVRAGDVGFVGAQQAQRFVQLEHVKRQIGVGINDDIARGRSKTRLHRAAELAIGWVVHHPHARVAGGCLVGQLGSRIGRSVVHHDEFVVAHFARSHQFACHIVASVECSQDVLLFVPHREKD